MAAVDLFRAKGLESKVLDFRVWVSSLGIWLLGPRVPKGMSYDE